MFFKSFPLYVSLHCNKVNLQCCCVSLLQVKEHLLLGCFQDVATLLRVLLIMGLCVIVLKNAAPLEVQLYHVNVKL